MGGKKVSAEEKSYIESQIRKGTEYKAIARRVERSPSYIAKCAREIGVLKGKGKGKGKEINGKSPAPLKPEVTKLEITTKKIDGVQKVLFSGKPEEPIPPEAKKGLELLFEPSDLGPLARLEESKSPPGVVELPEPRPCLVPPRKESQGPRLEEKEGRFNISVSIAPEIVLDQIIARGMMSPADVIAFALSYMRDEAGKLAAPQMIQLIAEITGAPL